MCLPLGVARMTRGRGVDLDPSETTGHFPRLVYAGRYLNTASLQRNFFNFCRDAKLGYVEEEIRFLLHLGLYPSFATYNATWDPKRSNAIQLLALFVLSSK